MIQPYAGADLQSVHDLTVVYNGICIAKYTLSIAINETQKYRYVGVVANDGQEKHEWKIGASGVIYNS